MRHLPGQAAYSVWVVAHRLLTLALALTVLATVALGVFAWRLAQGPLEVDWIARRLEAVANADGHGTLTIGSAALAWEGFSGGVDRPLDIRLRDIVATDAAGTQVFSIPTMEVSVSLGALLRARVEPRAIELHNARLRAHRAADGAVSVDLGPLTEGAPNGAPSSAPSGAPSGEAANTPVPAEAAPPADAPSPTGIITALLAELAHPATSDVSIFRDSRFRKLRRVLISDSALTVVDRHLGLTWRAPRVDIDLRRRPAGGVDGTAAIALAMGEEQALLRLTVALAAGGHSGQATASLSPIAPAALARLSPALAALRFLDAAVSLDARLELGAALAVREGTLEARIAPGRIVTETGAIVLRQGIANFQMTSRRASLRELRLQVAPRPDGPVSVLLGTGTVDWDGTQLRGRGRIGLDHVAFADLPILWPSKVSRNAREWITRNITAGTARNAQVEIALSADPDFANIQVTEVNGGLDAEDLSVHWLRPVPPIERARARLTINEPDVLEIVTTGGRQLLENARGDLFGNLTSPSGKVRITGLSQKDQIAQVDIDLGGPVAEMATLLRHPRLRLLDRSPFELRDPAGSMTARLAVTVPLENNLTLDDITIRALARTEGLRLAGIVAGRDLEQGSLDLDVTTESMKITGRATVAAIPAQLTVDLDFRPGSAAQVQQRVVATARADIRQLAAAATLDLAGMATGPASAQLTYTRRRDGIAEMRIGGDLRETELSFAPLVWRKPPGRPASMEARLRIQRDRITGIDDIALSGEALTVRARMEQVDGRLALLRLDRAMLGRTDANGTINFQPNGGRITATMRGASVDLAPRLTTPTTQPAPPARGEQAPDRPWTLDARFDTAILAHDVRLAGFTATAESNGTIIQRLRVDGRSAGGATHLEIMPHADGRRVSASSSDAGTLLRGLDVAHKLAGGTLSLDASYDDRHADRPLSGSARIDDFRILNAPAVTGLLQAMTLYGLVQMAQGPGLGITKLIAPFRMTDSTLELHDARAFNPSLGLTIKGRIDRIREICDLNGTIVPAYFFNSLLGDIPLIGRLFSPEAGGGLFAASYTVRGPLANPDVAVNPLSALTPGFLRGLFGNF